MRRNFLWISQQPVAPLTLAITVLRWVRPRPNIRRLARQPGFAAGFGASAVIFVGEVGNLATAGIDFGSPDVVIRYARLALKPSGAGSSLIVNTSRFWPVVGRRQPERTWIDRGGSRSASTGCRRSRW